MDAWDGGVGVWNAIFCADPLIGGTVDDEDEVYIVTADSNGTPTGGIQRISDVGVDGAWTWDAQRADITYAPGIPAMAIVWEGDDDVTGHAQNEFEIFAQLWSNGQALDSDSDGVPDLLDICPGYDDNGHEWGPTWDRVPAGDPDLTTVGLPGAGWNK